MTGFICENVRVNEGRKDSIGSELESASSPEENNDMKSSMMVESGESKLGDLKESTSPQTAESASHPLTNRAQNRGVGAIVSKAKRAAASLWMVLHAQGCRLGQSQCPHAGCKETKLLLLHVKKCAAGPEFDCPEGVQGCHQARKLLAHYRRCSAIRARQAGPGRRIAKQQPQHVCLVCSLVARHARTVLEGGRAPSHCVGVKTKRLVETQQPLKTASNGKSETAPNMSRSKSVEMMPPPPPRPPQAMSSAPPDDSKTASYVGSESVNLDSQQQSPWPPQQAQAVPGPARDQAPPVYGSPPTTPQLMQQRIEAVAQIAAPPPLAGGTTNPSLLGKSVDSSGSFMQSAAMLKERKAAETSESTTENYSHSHISFNLRRRRAESYDERKSSRKTSQYNISPNSLSEFSGGNTNNDPTVETMLKDNDNQQSYTEEETSASETSFAPKKLMLLRKRSSSCSVLSSLVRPGGCDTIDEEVLPTQHQPQTNENRE